MGVAVMMKVGERELRSGDDENISICLRGVVAVGEFSMSLRDDKD